MELEDTNFSCDLNLHELPNYRDHRHILLIIVGKSYRLCIKCIEHVKPTCKSPNSFSLIGIFSHSRMLKRDVLKKVCDFTVSNHIIALSCSIHDIFSGLLSDINLRLVFIYLFIFRLF
jgi:hypothetical protein